MSKFRAKAAEIKEAGIAERGNFTPQGVPLRMYNWWLSNSPSDKAADIRRGARKENFCHFWRVVLIWTPLIWSFLTFAAAVTTKTGMVVSAIIAVGILSVVVTTAGSWIGFFTILGLALAVIVAFFAVIMTGVWLAERYDWFEPALAITAITGFLGWLLVVGLIEQGPILFAYILAGALGLAAVIFVGWKFADFIAGKRALREANMNKEWDKYVAGEGPNPYERPAHVPNKFETAINAFFRGVGDFLILITQVVRVKKWGICPLVEVGAKPEDKIDYESGWETA